jgi:hypothetical protein
VYLPHGFAQCVSFDSLRGSEVCGRGWRGDGLLTRRNCLGAYQYLSLMWLAQIIYRYLACNHELTTTPSHLSLVESWPSLLVHPNPFFSKYFAQPPNNHGRITSIQCLQLEAALQQHVSDIRELTDSSRVGCVLIHFFLSCD